MSYDATLKRYLLVESLNEPGKIEMKTVWICATYRRHDGGLGLADNIGGSAFGESDDNGLEGVGECQGEESE